MIWAVVGMACLRAQPYQDLLLPYARHMKGVVVDAEGKPVAEARIEHTNDLRLHETDAEGRFEVETNAPIVVVRKAGFLSERLPVQDTADSRITLTPLGEKGHFPICPGNRNYVGITGWGGSLQFPKTPGVKASRQVRDVDYGARHYYIETQRGPKGILHGGGALWSLGIPSTLTVWRSVKYDEVMYDTGGGTAIIDARGELPGGSRWRYLGNVSESASYDGLDEATAKVLDKVLDSACLKPATPSATHR